MIYNLKQEPRNTSRGFLTRGEENLKLLSPTRSLSEIGG
jgi:hypothetical protein